MVVFVLQIRQLYYCSIVVLVRNTFEGESLDKIQYKYSTVKTILEQLKIHTFQLTKSSLPTSQSLSLTKPKQEKPFW